MAKLNIDSFNDILFSALKDKSVKGQIELIKSELNLVFDLFTHECGKLLDELVDYGYESETFTRIENIKANTEGLLLKLQELEAQLAEEEGSK